jgi:hypothetical protein
MAIPGAFIEWWHRYLPFGLAIPAILAPCALFAATLPGSATDGVIHLGSGYRSAWLWVAVGLVGLGLLVALLLRADHGLLFGCLTVAAALTTVAAFASVFVRRHVENDPARTFLLVAVLSLVSLTLIAHDWKRRQVVVAAAVVAAALSVFIVRVGFESLSVPPQSARAQIAAKARADEQALEAQHTRALPELKAAAQGARTALSAILARTPPPNVDPKLLKQANLILREANKSLTAVDPAAFSDFDVLVTNEPVTFPPAATTELADAVHALDTSAVAAATQVDHSALDQAICTVTGHNIGAKPNTCDTSGKDQITTNRAWAVAKHELDIELAAYRAAITGTEADKAALKAVLAKQPDVNSDISILAAIENGPQTLWRSVFHATGPALVPGPLGWVVLGVLLLGLLAWLLKVNASQLAGPVAVMPGDAESDQDTKLVKVLRVAVLQNVAEPGAAPGAPSANPVTDLLDIAGGPLATVSKIVQSVLTVVGRRYGYQISMDVTTDAPASSGTASAAGAATSSANASTATSSTARTSVLVRVMSVSDGTTLTSHICTAPVDEDAVRTAGLWAAGYILNRSSRIPSWAAWNAETAHALATAKSNRDVTLDALKSALQEAPDSGVVLVLLGHHYELAGRCTDAINCYGRAVAAYPRYLVAQYRLAAALAAMRHDTDWAGQPPGARQDDLRPVERAITALHVYVGQELSLLQTQSPLADAPGRFKALATSLLKALAKDVRYPNRLVSALRRSERDFIWPSLTPRSASVAPSFRQLVRSAYMALDEAELGELSDLAAKPGSWWQISYNAACGYASSPTVEDSALNALNLLEQTLVRPGVYQLSADWVKEDSDLAALKASPRFGRFLAQLRSGD